LIYLKLKIALTDEIKMKLGLKRKKILKKWSQKGEKKQGRI